MGKWFYLILVAVAVMLGMSVWLTAAAIGNVLQEKWSLGPNEVGWLLTSVQMGFVIGTFTAAVFNLADILPERVYFFIFSDPCWIRQCWLDCRKHL